MMTARKRRFIEEFMVDSNAKQSAIRAGYSERSANAIGSRLLTDDDVKNELNKRMKERSSAKIASADEVLEYLTSVLRGQSRAHEIVVEGVGDGCSEARLMEKPPSEKEKLKAGELLARRYGILTDKLVATVETPVFGGEDELAD